MLKFQKIKKLGRSPRVARTAEEVEQRLKQMRAWTRGPINKAISWLVQVGIAVSSTIYLRVFNKVRVHNKSILRRVKPPYMLISNHLTMLDDTLLDSLLYLPIGWYKMRYFPWHAPEEKNFFLGPVVAWFLKKAQCIPLTRGHGVFQPGMTRLKELLQSGHIVHIFPEGTRSRHWGINRGQVGVGRLAYQSQAKVVPIYHEGTQHLLPIGSHRPQVGVRVEVIVGDPIDMSDLYAKKESREVYQEIADRMVQGFRDLRAELHAKGCGVVDIPEEVLEEGVAAKRDYEDEESSSER